MGGFFVGKTEKEIGKEVNNMKELDPNRQLPAISQTRQNMESVRQISANGWIRSARNVVTAARGEVSVSVEGMAKAKTVLGQIPADPQNPGKLGFEQRHARATLEVFDHLPMKKQGEILHDNGIIVFDSSGLIVG